MNRVVGLAVALLVGLSLVLWLARPESAYEWAAWIQAIGVLMALVWGAQLQHEAANRTRRQAQHVAALFAANLHWVFRELGDACVKQNWADFVVHRRILEEILAQGREASLQQLDGRGLAMVTSLRTIAVEALEVMVPHTADGDWVALQGHFEKRLSSISAWLSTSGHPAVGSGPTDYEGLRTSFGHIGTP